MKEDVNETIALAAYDAAECVTGHSLTDVLSGGPFPVAFIAYVDFLRRAGDVPGATLYRWGAGQSLHALPADGWENVSPSVRVWFDTFAATAKAVAQVVDPSPDTARRLSPQQNHVPVSQTIHEKYPKPGERTHAGMDRSQPTSTAQVPIFRMAQPVAPDDAPPPAPQGAAPPAFTPSQTAYGGDLDALGSRPSMEALREQFRRADPGDISHIYAEQLPPAPPAANIELRNVTQQAGDETVSGVVPTGRV